MNLCWSELAASQGVNRQQCSAPSMNLCWSELAASQGVNCQQCSVPNMNLCWSELAASQGVNCQQGSAPNMNLCWSELAASQGVNRQQCSAPSTRTVHLCSHHLTNTKRTRQLMNPPLPCTTRCDHSASLSLSAQEKKKISSEWPNPPPPPPPKENGTTFAFKAWGLEKSPTHGWTDGWERQLIYTKIKLK